MTMRRIALVLVVGAAACAPSTSRQATAPAPAAAISDSTYAVLWRQGQTWPQFRDAIDARPQLWARVRSIVAIPDAVVQRAQALGTWKLMIVADDDCSDSGNSLPYIARLAELAPNLELRIVPDELGQHVKEAHRAPDGRAAFPLLVLLDDGWHDRGCWVERPAQLQWWYMTRGHLLMDSDVDSYRREKQGFYDFDHGESTLNEVLGMIEAARGGSRVCGITPHAY
jgi:hypothetical protein